MSSSKETIKSIMIIGLFMVALFLTQWVMYDGLFANDIDQSDIEVQSDQLSKYINPQSYLVSFGGISYTRIYDSMLQDQIWSELSPILIEVFLSYDSLIPIERETFIEAFNDRGILLRMPFALSVSELVSIHSDQNPDLDVASIHPYEYIFRDGAKQSVYVYDQKNDAYYELQQSALSHDVDALVGLVEGTGRVEYRKISDRFSLQSTVDETHNQENYELIPFQYGKIVAGVEIQNEIFFVNNDPVGGFQEIVENVFGNRMDFVKRLKDVSGSTIFMYGYGEKTLTFSQNGGITYQKRFDPNFNLELTFKDALAIAAGRLENFGMVKEQMQLVGYEKIENTHVFKFNYKIDDYFMALSGSGLYPIEVEVRGNQVVRVYKDVKKIVEHIDNQSIDRLYSIDECIENNFLEVSVYYLQDNNIYDSALENMAYYFPIRSAINQIELRYTKVDSKSSRLVPTWQVVISNRTYLFNAYTGNLIKTYR